MTEKRAAWRIGTDSFRLSGKKQSFLSSNAGMRTAISESTLAACLLKRTRYFRWTRGRIPATRIQASGCPARNRSAQAIIFLARWEQRPVSGRPSHCGPPHYYPRPSVWWPRTTESSMKRSVLPFSILSELLEQFRGGDPRIATGDHLKPPSTRRDKGWTMRNASLHMGGPHHGNIDLTLGRHPQEIMTSQQPEYLKKVKVVL